MIRFILVTLLLALIAACDHRPPSGITTSVAPSGPGAAPSAPPPPPGMAPVAAPAAAPVAGRPSPPAAPPAPPTVNEHPDLVKFDSDWGPHGPYERDQQVRGHPETPEANERLVGEVIDALNAAADNPAAQEQALMTLRNTYLSKARRSEVSALLETLLGSPAQRIQILAVSQCSTWGTPQNLPTLETLASLDDPYVSSFAVHDIYCITNDLSRIGKYLVLKHGRYGAAWSFQVAKSGEEYVWPHLDSPDPEVVSFACAQLYHVGTAQSAPRLAALKRHPDPNVSGYARAAINGIQHRARR